MPLSFFPAYCGIVLLAAAAVQKFFVVGAPGNLVSFECRRQPRRSMLLYSADMGRYVAAA